MKESTFVLLKPDCLHRGHVGLVLNILEDAGYKITGMRMDWLSTEEVRNLYQKFTNPDTPFFSDLHAYMVCGPVVLVRLLGDDGTILRVRALAEGIRGSLALDFRRNTIHSSDGAESAKRELDLFFPDDRETTDDGNTRFDSEADQEV